MGEACICDDAIARTDLDCPVHGGEPLPEPIADEGRALRVSAARSEAERQLLEALDVQRHALLVTELAVQRLLALTDTSSGAGGTATPLPVQDARGGPPIGSQEDGDDERPSPSSQSRLRPGRHDRAGVR